MEPTDARAPVSLVVVATTLVVSTSEYLYWAALGDRNEWAPVALTSLGIAAVAALAARPAPRGRGLLLGLALAYVPFGSVALESVLHALALGVVFVVTAALFARARRARVAGLTAFVVLAATLHHHSSLHDQAPTGDVLNELPDIVLLVMDTTRRDRLSVYGYPKPTTPNLDDFAEHAQVYDDAWSVAPWTSPSHASMFTGLLPAEHGVDGALAVSFPEGIPTLPKVLSEAGYRTAGFPGNANLFAPGWDRDFDVYLPAEYQKNHSLIRALNNVSRRWRDPAAHALGDRLLARARRWWGANDDAPRFLFVNLIEPHSPYIPADEFYEQFLPGFSRDEAFAVQARMRPDGSASPTWKPREIEILSRLYDAEIAGMDRRIGHFVDWLDARGDFHESLFVITSDHGERLGERGLVDHSLVMDPYLLRVPLLVSYPSKLEPARISKRVQLDGLAGYVLHTAGLAAPDAMGRFDESVVAVAQYRPPASIVDDMVEIDPEFDAERYRRDWCFVANDRFALEWAAAGTPVLTDLESDPNFTLNVATDYPNETEALLEIARELPRFESKESRDMDPELAKKLKALGYVQE